MLFVSSVDCRVDSGHFEWPYLSGRFRSGLAGYLRNCRSVFDLCGQKSDAGMWKRAGDYGVNIGIER